DFTRIFVRLPSTCGCSVAERRLLIVDTYVSDVGTALSATGCTCTGIACAAGPAAGGALVHPAINATANPATAYTGTRRSFQEFCTQCKAVLLKLISLTGNSHKMREFPTKSSTTNAEGRLFDDRPCPCDAKSRRK